MKVFRVNLIVFLKKCDPFETACTDIVNKLFYYTLPFVEVFFYWRTIFTESYFILSQNCDLTKLLKSVRLFAKKNNRNQAIIFLDRILSEKVEDIDIGNSFEDNRNKSLLHPQLFYRVS